MIKAIILVFFLISFCHSNLLSEIKDFFHNNKCLNEKLISPLHVLWDQLLELNNSDLSSQESRIQLAKDLANLLAQVQEIKVICNLNEASAFLHDDWLVSAGYLFLTTSNCFKDVGADLLILDSVIQSFEQKNYTDSFMNAIALGIVGYQGYQDCKPLVDFFQVKKSSIDYTTNYLEIPGNDLGGCSYWGIIGCSAAVASAAVACGGPVDPAIAACIVAAVAAIPGCGVCLCQALNCPNHCPCG